MTLSDQLSVLPPLSLLDAIALGLLLLCWFVLGLMIENRKARRPSVSVLMIEYRRIWMSHVVSRDPRVFDSMIVSDLRQGTAFFASTSMIALGGGLALIGNVEQLSGLAADLTQTRAPNIVWEIKLVVILLFLTNAFLNFVWAHRVFGYCAVMLGAVPNDREDPQGLHRADQAADLNISAARAFNRGLRSVYFAIGGLAWLIGAAALILATGVTAYILLRREFWSATRATLLRKLN